LSFNVTFDPSTATAPANFFIAFNREIQFFQTTFSDPITINPHVGWGDIGWVGFNGTESYTFDPNNRAVTGAFDFFGVADHEITEVMGRYGFGQNGGGGRDSPIDLFRYFSPGVRDLAAAYGSPNYFSIDGGLTVINTFNVVCCGDLSDWAGNTIDPFNGFLTRGRAELLSPGDLIVMDVLGYDRISAVPEPAIWIYIVAGLICFAAARRRTST